jgi:hypothetical protein
MGIMRRLRMEKKKKKGDEAKKKLLDIEDMMNDDWANVKINQQNISNNNRDIKGEKTNKIEEEEEEELMKVMMEYEVKKEKEHDIDGKVFVASSSSGLGIKKSLTIKSSSLYYGYRTILTKLLSNIIYFNSVEIAQLAQTEVRSSSSAPISDTDSPSSTSPISPFSPRVSCFSIPLILGLTNHDDNNPFIREAAVWALRAMTLGAGRGLGGEEEWMYMEQNKENIAIIKEIFKDDERLEEEKKRLHEMGEIK